MTIFSFDCGTAELFLFLLLCYVEMLIWGKHYKTVLWVFHVLLENLVMQVSSKIGDLITTLDRFEPRSGHLYSRFAQTFSRLVSGIYINHVPDTWDTIFLLLNTLHTIYLSLPQREVRDVCCYPSVWNIRAVIWFLFPISSLVCMPMFLILCVLSFFPENSLIFFV